MNILTILRTDCVDCSPVLLANWDVFYRDFSFLKQVSSASYNKGKGMQYKFKDTLIDTKARYTVWDSAVQV
jgi:hypothetical protein